MTTSIETSPQYKNLEGLYNSLKDELIKLIAERDDLINSVKRNIEADYQLKIGRKQYELFTLRVEALRLKRKMEMYQAAINRGNRCSEEVIESLLDQEFKQWQQEAKELYEKITYAEYFINLPKLSPEEYAEHKKLYRELAKKLHPDINPDAWDNIKSLWLRIKEAYKNGDLQELKTLALLSDDYNVQSEPSTMDKLQQNCDTLKGKIKELITQMAGIKKQFPFDIADMLDDPDWVSQKNKETDVQIQQWAVQKKAYDEQVSHLIMIATSPTIH